MSAKLRFSKQLAPARLSALMGPALLAACGVPLDAGHAPAEPSQSQFGREEGELNRHRPKVDNMTTQKSNSKQDLTPLNTAEVRAQLIGRRIEPDPIVPQQYVWFAESFLENGTWIGRRSERGPVTRNGKWQISDEQICVAVDDGRERCRTVYRHEAILNDLVEGGRYPIREDVLREGVRLVQDREARLARIDAAVSRGRWRGRADPPPPQI